MAKEDREWYEVVNVTGLSNGAVYRRCGRPIRDDRAGSRAFARSQRTGLEHGCVPPWAKTLDSRLRMTSSMMVSVTVRRNRSCRERMSSNKRAGMFQIETNGLNWTVVRGSRGLEERQGIRRITSGISIVTSGGPGSVQKSKVEHWWPCPWSYGERQQVGSEIPDCDRPFRRN